ncbi:hypothetical protein MHBO_002316 [Bonamia ostreae]|uniref:Uncharacterized protein n=1 Tax=Bonamia ostreae TaxID=126728 RepID=A0ABV2AM12_9EUKA
MSLGRKLCRNWLFSRNLKISRLRLSQNRFFCEAKTEKNKDKNINSDKAKEEAKIETKSDKIRKDKIKTIGKFYQALIKKGKFCEYKNRQ